MPRWRLNRVDVPASGASYPAFFNRHMIMNFVIGKYSVCFISRSLNRQSLSCFKSHTVTLKSSQNLSQKMVLQLNLIAAACENMGIGINGRLPWKLKSEMAFFTDMTKNTKDENKMNVVIMGRRTWECIPKKFRPLTDRINIVLTSRSLDLGDDAIVCKSISAALNVISVPPLSEKVEKIWVIGGNSVYKEAMQSPNFHRLYLTEIKKNYDCDTFFPQIPNDFVEVDDPNVSKGIQEENGIAFEYKVYEKH